MTDQTPTETPSPLLALVGRTFRFQGGVWRVIEVLVGEGLVVLEAENGVAARPIRPNQFGQASRRAPECRVLPIHAEQGEGYSDVFMALLTAEQIQ